MEIKELKTLGLTNGEIKVYSAILNIGSSSINNIHEKTGMERRAIYDIINKLIEKGLISYTIERGKRTYQCAPTQKLKELINLKKQEIEEFEKILPDINKTYNSLKPDINIEIFRGKEGIKTLFEDMLNYKENFFIGGRWYVAKEMPLFWENYDKRRIKKGVKWNNLVLYDALKQPTNKFVETKTLPKEFSGSPAIIWIYGNKVVNVIWKDYFIALLIESEDIANNYKKYFDYLWKAVAKS
ncbi:MAG: helix-turn-helix domain-containing protein [Candidatus Pacearchaeota archaeon]|jgi:sugar-specific transcriptional regulator TrmB